ncbi:Irs4 protein [Saccharomycopsis crataegensis]|uniref:Irs4 protein n=1 Tax=Saccharomycopsis crataegensis TaxID=43959 RepID=A0AAV5QS73_9ASCO|nr:Irs4 protein [Saccharomycopsis crataegensis]
MFGNSGLSSKPSRKARPQPPSAASSLAAQAAVATFNKSNGKNESLKKNPKPPSQPSMPVAISNSPKKKKGSDMSPSSTVSSSPVAYPIPIKSYSRPRIIHKGSSYDMTKHSPPILDSNGFINDEYETESDSNRLSMAAIAAAAIAAKKISAITASDDSSRQTTQTKHKPNVLNTRFLQPPSNDSSRSLKPPLSPVSSVSNNSNINFSPGGLTKSKSISLNHYHSSESLKHHHNTQFDNELRSSSAGPTCDKRSLMTKASNSNKKLQEDLKNNKSFISLSDNYSSSDLDNPEAKIIKVRSMSPPTFYVRKNDTQDSFHASPCYSSTNNHSQLSLSQLSVPKLKLDTQLKRASTDAVTFSAHEFLTPPNKLRSSFQLDTSSSSNNNMLNIPRSSHSELSDASSIVSNGYQQKTTSQRSLNNTDSGQPSMRSYEPVDNYDVQSKNTYRNSNHYPEKDEDEEEACLSDLEGVELDNRVLPQYPSSVGYHDYSASQKKSRLTIRKKGKKMLRDLGLKSGGDHKSHKSEVSYYNINTDMSRPQYYHNQQDDEQQLLEDDEQQKQKQHSKIRGAQKPVEFKTTMREKSHNQQKFNADKPWKHHNDSLVVTEAEKKRYEGVWVANRGLYMNLMRKPINDTSTIKDMSVQDQNEAVILNSNLINAIQAPSHTQELNHPSQLVHGYVVRSLWRRSNLSYDILSQIWSLVDLRKDGTLNRDEFLVGMWLVDQCLYGRKLPKALDDSVWSSVQRLVVQVVIKPRKGKLLK